MKNKSRGYNNPISGIKNGGFALNGTLRNQGYVGQDSLSRKYIRTPFKGNYPVGNGGHLGKYYVNKIYSCSNCLNDPTIIKKSTMSNLGHINSSLLYPTTCKGGCVVPIVSTKSTEETTAGNYISSQSDYIESIRTIGSSCIDSDSEIPKINSCNNSNNNNNKNNKCGSYSKSLSPFSQGDYMSSVIYKKKCITK